MSKPTCLVCGRPNSFYHFCSEKPSTVSSKDVEISRVKIELALCTSQRDAAARTLDSVCVQRAELKARLALAAQSGLEALAELEGALGKAQQALYNAYALSPQKASPKTNCSCCGCPLIYSGAAVIVVRRYCANADCPHPTVEME